MSLENYKVLKNVYSNIGEFTEKYNMNNGYYPIDVEIRINWRCNARCKMCGLHSYIMDSGHKRQREFEEDDIYLLLDQLHALHCSCITFTGGEPTLFAGLARIIDYAAHKHNMNVSLNTNAYLLTKDRIEEYINAGIDSFTISILSPEQEIHDSIMGLKNGLQNTINAIDYINEYSNKINRKVKIYINNVLLKENIDSLIQYKEFCKEHKINHLNFSAASISTDWDEWTASDEELRPTLEQARYLKEVIIPQLQMPESNIFVEDPFGDSDEEIKENLHVKFSDVPNQCYIPMVHTVIQCNGDVIPCCYAPDKFIMGNVFQETLQDIWQGEKYKSFREECRQLSLEMCKSCRQYIKINTSIHKKLESNGGN